MISKCTGAAHSNPFIDNCGVCMPNWEWVVTESPKPEGLAGLLITRRNPINLGEWVSIYLATSAKLDTGTKYAVVCESHGAILGADYLWRAKKHLTTLGWCEDCRKLVEVSKTLIFKPS